jgi:Methyltransferase domain
MFYYPFLKRFRQRRMKTFSKMFSLTKQTRIIDVGGYPFNWSLIEEEPSILLVNLEREHWVAGRFEKVNGDGRCLEYKGNSFDIAYSNSVIEHVGDWQSQVAFANEIRRVAPRYYVQTPNKWFFVEPHLIAPFIHWFPESIRRKLVPYFSLWFWITKPRHGEVDALIKSICLLDKKNMQKLFPDAEILEEKLLWATKSIIALRR